MVATRITDWLHLAASFLTVDERLPVRAEADSIVKNGDRAYDSPEFMVAEVAALRRECAGLRHQLAARTEAWRSVLRELSELQTELSELRQEVTVQAPEPLTSSDWDSILGTPPPPGAA